MKHPAETEPNGSRRELRDKMDLAAGERELRQRNLTEIQVLARIEAKTGTLHLAEDGGIQLAIGLSDKQRKLWTCIMTRLKAVVTLLAAGSRRSESYGLAQT